MQRAKAITNAATRTEPTLKTAPVLQALGASKAELRWLPIKAVFVRMHDVEHISIYIHRAPDDVYVFASKSENLPRWAAGLASSEVKRDGDVWVADAPFGKVRIKFAEPNSFGVMDHDVELDSGVVVHNPMRVVPNGDGSELIFTLLRQPGMSKEKFASDARAVDTDLRFLKKRLERDS